MKKAFLLSAIIAFHAIVSFAQKENNVWAFGDRMGLDFNGTTPTLIQTSIRTLGGSASVCDANGQLLFYTQGDTIWNRNNQIMSNGIDLIAPYFSNTGTQTSQGQLILPVINNPKQYYVFSLEATTDYVFNSDPYASRLYYSVVDMTLNNGLGNVVPGQKKIKLDSILTGEKMIAVQGTNCSIWLLVHNIEDNKFKAYNINNIGINTTPVVSTTGNMTQPLSYAFGKLKASPDGNKLAASNWFLGNYGCELFDFNKTTGVVTNPMVIDSIPESISACFSPDNSKLYVFSFAGGNGALYQYNLSLPTHAAILASKTLIDTLYDAGTAVYDAKLGPDGKIYVKMPYSPTTLVPHDTIGRIDFPNLAGTACGYTRAALISSQVINLGNGDLPNQFVKPAQDTTFISSTTNLTITGSVVLQAPAGYDTHLWSNLDTASSITVSATGTYWVTSTNYCSRRIDTFKVEPKLGILTLGQAGANMIVYPNPATDNITIGFATGMQLNGELRIVDMTGKTVMATMVNKQILSVSTEHIANGVYQVIYMSESNAGLRLQGRLVIAK